MFETRRLRLLTLDAAQHPRGQHHLSSASGLALAGHHLYIAADDENHLARLDARDLVASQLVLTPFAQSALPIASDAYADGACVGCVIGGADGRGEIRFIEQLRGNPSRYSL